jgi:hypothetical protein
LLLAASVCLATCSVTLIPTATPSGDLAVGTTFDVWLKDGSDKLVYNVTALNAPHSITLSGENGTLIFSLFSQCESTVSVCVCSPPFTSGSSIKYPCSFAATVRVFTTSSRTLTCFLDTSISLSRAPPAVFCLTPTLADTIRAVDTITFAERTAESGGGVHIHYSADIGLRGWKCIFNPFIGGTLQKLATDTENGCRAAFAEKKHEK